MKKFLFCFFLSFKLFGQNACAPPAIDFVSHSAARVQTNCNFAANLLYISYCTTNTKDPIRTPCTPGSQGTAGSYARVQGLYSGQVTAAVGQSIGYNLANLYDTVLYNVQVAVSPDAGVTWVYTANQTFTTLALPAQHPALPIHAKKFNPVVPTGPFGTKWIYNATLAGFTTCGVSPLDLQDCLNQATYGDEIVIPSGVGNAAVPTVNGYFYFPDGKDIVNVTADTSTSHLTCGGACGLANSSAVRFGSTFSTPTPLQAGYTYCVISSGTGATSFQVYASTNNDETTCTVGSPTPITITYLGNGQVSFVVWPPDYTKQIYVVSSDAILLPPVGVQLNGNAADYSTTYASHMAYLQANPSQILSSGGKPMILAHDAYNGHGSLSHGWYFYGVELKGANLVTLPLTSTDPIAQPLMYSSDPQNFNITFDHTFVSCGGYPNRCAGGYNHFDGAETALINSSLFSDFWIPFVETGDSQLSSPNNTTVNLTSNVGGFWLNNTTGCTAPASSLHITGGTPSDTNGFIGFTMGCVLTAWIPNGLTFTSSNLTVVQQATPAWPVDGGGRIAAGEVAQLGFSGATIPFAFNVPDSNYAVSNVPYGTDASFAVSVAYGPGPTKVSNDNFNFVGIGIYYTADGSIEGACDTSNPCLPLYQPQNCEVDRNVIDTDPALRLTGSSGVHVHYFSRHNIEFKRGQQCEVYGNILRNNYADVNAGGALLINTNCDTLTTSVNPTANCVDQAKNFDLQGNSIVAAAAGFNMGGANPGMTQKPGPGANYYVANNTVQTSGWTRAIPPTYGSASPGWATGACFQSLSGIEDLWLVQNTLVQCSGSIPGVVIIIESHGEGTSVWGNIANLASDDGGNFGLTFEGYEPGNGYPSTPDYTGQSGNTVITEGVNWDWGPNVLVCGYSNSQTLVDLTTGQCSTLATGYPNDLFTLGSTALNRQAAVGFLAPSASLFGLAPGSGFTSGVSPSQFLLDMGANFDLIDQMQGNVRNVHVYGITSSSANVSFIAPDSFGCLVDWSQNNFATFTQTTNPGGNRNQNVALTGLPSGVRIQYRVNCAANQPTGSFNTN